MAIFTLFGNRDSSAGATAEDALQTPSAKPETSKPTLYLTLFLSQIREMGCYAASTGRGLDTYRQRLCDIATARREAIETEQQATRVELTERLNELKQRVRAASGGLEFDGPLSTTASLKREVAFQRTIVAGMVSEARSDRFMLKLRRQHLAVKEQTEIEEEWLKGRINRAQDLLQVAEQEFSANRVERERQAHRLEVKSEEYRGQLTQARARVAELDERGISRHVAAFLVWASSVSLVGVGIAVGQLLSRVLTRSQQHPEDSLLLTWLRNVSTPADLLLLFGAFTGIVVGAVAIIAGVTASTRYLLRRYDPDWRPASDPEQSQSENGLSDWLSLFSFAGQLGFGGQSARKGISDRSLQQILGLLPVIVAAAMCSFLFIAFGDRSAGSSPFIAAQMGPAFALLSIVGMMLLIANVLSAKRDGKRVSVLSRLVFVPIALLPVVALFLAGLNIQDNNDYSLAAVTISMTLSASGLAFGVVYRGQFARQDYLEREIERIEQHVAILRTQPTVAGMLNHVGFGQPSARTKDRPIQQNVQAAWEGLWKALASLWPKGKTTPAASVDTDDVDRLLHDPDIAPDRLKDITQARAKQSELTARLASLEDLEKQIAETRAALADGAKAYRNSLRDLAIEEARAELELRNAFDIACTTLGNPWDDPHQILASQSLPPLIEPELPKEKAAQAGA